MTAEYTTADSVGYTSIFVLPQLWGRPWDRDAMNVVHALRPSSVVVTRGEMNSDARCWRVAVYIDSDDRIRWIEQEVEVGLHERENGFDVRGYIESRVNSALSMMLEEWIDRRRVSTSG